MGGLGKAAPIAYDALMEFSVDESPLLTPACESALLEQFLRAEAMALWAVRSAQLQHVPPNVQRFLRRHEEDEQEHLAQFESIIGRRHVPRSRLPSVPHQWPALAVQLYGYECLGLEFAKLLARLRPDLTSILEDETVHVEFFEEEIRRILSGRAHEATQARVSAAAWWKKLPKTIGRYLDADVLHPFRQTLHERMLTALERRLMHVGLFDRSQPGGGID